MANLAALISVPRNVHQPSGEQFLPVATFTNNPVVPPQIIHMDPPAKPYTSPSPKAILSLTPEKKKIERIVSQRQYQKIEKAGRLAVALAALMFGEIILKVSSVRRLRRKKAATDNATALGGIKHKEIEVGTHYSGTTSIIS